MFILNTKNINIIKEVYRISYEHRYTSTDDKPDRRKCELASPKGGPIRLDEILPDVMTNIKKRINSKKEIDANSGT